MGEIKFYPDIGNLKEETVIWKYLDLPKFLSLLESDQLFFAQPKTFEDTWEGEFSEDDYNLLPIKAKGSVKQQLRVAFKFIRDLTVISCWHINEHESAAMWKLYLNSGQGIAIKSTIKKLIDSLDIVNLKNDIHIGAVKYIDYSKDSVSKELDDLTVFFSKRLSFCHENELRAVIPLYLSPKTNEYMNADLSKLKKPQGGIGVTTDLNTLIDEVYLEPNTPPWLEKAIKDLMTKYSLDKIKITKSSLYNLS